MPMSRSLSRLLGRIRLTTMVECLRALRNHLRNIEKRVFCSGQFGLPGSNHSDLTE